MATNSTIILPDSSAGAFVFTAPEVPYTYMEGSRTFWGMTTSIEEVQGIWLHYGQLRSTLETLIRGRSHLAAVFHHAVSQMGAC